MTNGVSRIPSIFLPCIAASLMPCAVVSCAKKEPEALPQPAPVVKQVKKKTPEPAVNKPSVDADLELANQLRDPAEMMTLEGAQKEAAFGQAPKVISTEASPVIPEIPQPSQPTPAPPLPKVDAPDISDKTAMKKSAGER